MASSVLTQAKGAAAPVRVQATAKAGSSARLGAASALSRKAGLVPIFSRTPRASSLVVNTMAPDAKLPFSPNSDHLEEWVPSSWRALEALQQPNWPSQDALAENLEVIKRSPPLVFAGESRDLQNRLAQASRGEAFLLQGGDCAESFDDFSANHIRDTYRVLLQMSAVVMYGGGVPVVKIGRMAGQFAKPRSADTEIKGDEELPSYRGDIINGPEWSAEARVPDPSRLVRAYHQSAATLNLIRGFSSGGYASLERVANWNLDFMENSEQGAKFKAVAKQIDESLRFMEACGIGSDHPLMKTTEFYTSHECLLLDYEEALTREDSTTGLWYDCSAHMIWCGERTRQLDKAHVEFLKGVGNPLGVKVSDKMPPQDLVTLCQMLNPDNVPGRITIIVRMGAENVKEHFPKLVRAAKDAGIVVTWVSDPMHGNTISAGGYKTRPFESVCAEVMAFFDVHDEEGSVPGGVHLEMTGEDVTECTGGGALVSEDDLSSRYHTHCDPRLNAAQSLELAFIISTRLRQHKELVAKRNGKPAANWN